MLISFSLFQWFDIEVDVALCPPNVIVPAVGIPVGKVPDSGPIVLELRDFSTIFIEGDRRFLARVAKLFFGSGFFRSPSFLRVSCR